MRKICVMILASVLFISGLYSEGLQDVLNKIADNQSKIKTEIAIGKLIINVYNEKNEKTNSFSKDLSLYLKYPNMIKIMINSEDNKNLIVTQIGDVMSQKMSDSNQVTTKKVTEQSDLFKKYLGYGIEKILQGFYTNGGHLINENVFEYELLPKEKNTGIEKYIIRIDQITGMNIYDSYFSKEEQIVEIAKEYQKIKDIYVLKKLTLITRKDNIKMETIFDYKSFDLNTKILDKEFELQ